MKSHEIYNLIICLIVFVLLTGLLSYLIVALIRYTLRAIRAGLEDEAIIKEFEAKKDSAGSRILKVLDRAFPIFVCVLLGVALCFSLYSKFTANDKVGKIPTVKVVETGSMESKHPSNAYLVENNLNDQIQTFDAIVLHQLPKEQDLQLYDIVVYQTRGYYIVHRIVGIEEPNQNHPNERWFVLRGDANKQADDFPVTYKQMVSIYRGERVPFVGSIVFFMQSPAGMLCFLLVVFAMIATPIAEKKILEAKKARYALIRQTAGAAEATGEDATAKTASETEGMQASLTEAAAEPNGDATPPADQQNANKEGSPDNLVHPVIGWGLIGSVALLVLTVALYCFLF